LSWVAYMGGYVVAIRNVTDRHDGPTTRGYYGVVVPVSMIYLD
jgi:hypothetical protein